MRPPILFCVLALPFLVLLDAQGAPSDWLSTPRPDFPPSALRKGSEGSVRLRIVLARDGNVAKATVLKSSGDTVLDEAAENSVLKWKMKPSAIKPSDLTTGRVEEIDFRQEGMMGAEYPLFIACVATELKTWIFAPVPTSPADARLHGQEGKVIVRATIAVDGSIVLVRVAKSSGHSDLDNSALDIVRHWRAHKQFAGEERLVVIEFSRRRLR